MLDGRYELGREDATYMAAAVLPPPLREGTHTAVELALSVNGDAAATTAALP